MIPCLILEKYILRVFKGVMSVKVILQSEVENLGKNGDVLVVADGYGRNYLLPKGLAVKATPQNLKKLEALIKAREEQKKEEIEIARGLEAKINEITVVIRAKAGDKGKLFGSVTNSDIVAQLEEQHGIVVDKRKVDLKQSIKETGFYTVNIKLHPEVNAGLKVSVEPEQDQKKQPVQKAEEEPEQKEVLEEVEVEEQEETGEKEE